MSPIAAAHFYAEPAATLPWEGDLAQHEGREVEVVQATYYGDLVVRDPAKPAGLEVVAPGACTLIRRRA